MLPSFVGLIGEKRHGKDAAYALALAPLGYTRVALADPLKVLTAASIMHDAARIRYAAESAIQHAAQSARDAYRKVYIRKDDTAREALQLNGDDIRDHVDPGYFIALALEHAHCIIAAGGRVAFTDIRYENEAQAIRGDVRALHDAYTAREAAGLPIDPDARRAMTRAWGDGGAIPPPGTGMLLKVVRPSVQRDALSEHRSEASARALEGHVTVTNDGTLYDLRERVAAAVLGWRPSTSM